MKSGSLDSVNKKLDSNKLMIAIEKKQIIIVEEMLSLLNDSLNNQIISFKKVTDNNNKTVNEIYFSDYKGTEKTDRKRKNSDMMVESCNNNFEPPYTIPQKINPDNINFIPYAQPLKSGINMGKGKYEGRGPRKNVPNYPPMVNNMSNVQPIVRGPRMNVPNFYDGTINFPPAISKKALRSQRFFLKQMELSKSSSGTSNPPPRSNVKPNVGGPSMDVCESSDPSNNHKKKKLKPRHERMRKRLPKPPRVNTNVPPKVSNVSLGKDQVVCQRMEVPDSEGVTFSHISLIHGHMVSGSNGYLSKWNIEMTVVYDTKVNDNIWFFESISLDKKVLVIACSRLKVLIFKNKSKELIHSVNFPEEYVDNIVVANRDAKTIYFTLRNGSVKSIREKEWIFVDEFTPRDDSIRRLFAVSMHNSSWLATFQDSLFYKITVQADVVKTKEVISGVKDVKNVIKCNRDMFICYSDTNVWILNENLSVATSLSLRQGIKLVTTGRSDMVVVDVMNTIHVYTISKEDNYGKKSFEKDLGGVITFVSVYSDKVYMIRDNEFISMRIR